MSASNPVSGDVTEALVGQIAEEFSRRREQGEQPTIDEYASRYPEHAELIRDILSTLLLVEVARPDPDETLAARSAHRPFPPRLGDFLVGREVGRGGMGIVHEAEQASLKRRVALKIIPRGRGGSTSSGTAEERFRHECEAAARLQHPHIVPIYAYGSDQGFDFYAMQFVDGVSLAELFGERPPTRPFPGKWSTWKADSPVERHTSAVLLGVRIAEALQHAHERGVLHRDVKPANILLDSDGHPWLTDFGLARLDDGSGLTGTGDLLGTLRYMAPERFRGWADPRSDVYALGVTLHELVSGQLAYRESDQVQLVRRITQEDLPPLRQIAAGLPRDFETVLQKATAREPADRYASAGEFADDLRRVLEGRPIAAVRRSALTQVMRWSRRNPLISSLAGLVAMLLIALSVGGLLAAQYYRNTAETERGLRVRAERAEKGQRVEAENAKRSARLATRRQFEAIRANARSTRLSGFAGQQQKALDLIREAVALKDQCDLTPSDLGRLRQEAIEALSTPDLVFQQLALPGVYKPTAPVAFSPDFTLVAASVRGGIVLFRWPEKKPAGKLVDPDGRGAGPRRMQFNRDGTRLLAEYQSEIRVWNVTTRAVEHQGRYPEARTAVIHPFEPWLVVSLQEETEVVRWTDGEVLSRIPLGAILPTRMSISPDGQRLALAGRDTFGMWNLTTGERVGVGYRGQSIRACDWTHDGRFVIIATNPPGMVRIDGETGRGTSLVAGGGICEEIACSPRESLFVTRGLDERLRLWDAERGQLLCTAPFGGKYLQFDPAGRQFGPALDESGWGVAEVVPRQIVQRIEVPERGRAVSLSIDPSGSWLATAHYPNTVQIWSLATRTLLGEITRPEIHGAFFLPDGSGLAVVCGDRLELCPIRTTDAGAELVADEPVVLHLGKGLSPAESFSRDGHFVCLEQRRHTTGCVVVLIEPQSTTSRPLGPVPRGVRASISPDGKWAVAVTVYDRSATLFDLKQGTRRSLTPPGEGPCNAAVFSPQGDRLIVTTTTGHHVFLGPTWTWERTWQRRKESSYEPNWAFNRSGTLTLHNDGTERLELRTFPDWEFLAAFDASPERPFTLVSLTPQGDRLATYDGRSFEIWDLRRVRQLLSDMQLDWRQPPIPPEASPMPLRIRVARSAKD